MRILFLSLLILFSSKVSGQSDSVRQSTRKSNHYIGVQANELLRQIFNFGGSSSTAVSPYFLTYAVNAKNNGVGLNVGLGYSVNNTSNSDPFSPSQTSAHSFNWRMGLEKKSSIGKRWLLSWGVDILVSDANTRTETTINTGGPGIKTITETSQSGWGLGPRFTLNFLITDKIVVGTEATYYFRSLSSTQKVTGQQDITTKPTSLNFAVPAVIFIIMRF